jgi:hypothetical protein
MTGVFGSVKVSNVKRASATGLPSQSAILEEFSKSLSKDKVVAVHVADDEATIEGGVWLALMDGKAEVLAKDELHKRQLFEKGWTVARGHWFSLKRVLPNSRIYCALEKQTLFNMQSMIRLDNVRFQQTLWRPNPSEWVAEFTLSKPRY